MSARPVQTDRTAAKPPEPRPTVGFDNVVQTLVNRHQPRIGAVVQILGDNVDAHIAGWILDHGDNRICLVAGDTDPIVRTVERPEHALAFFRRPPLVRNELHWCGPQPQDSGPDDED